MDYGYILKISKKNLYKELHINNDSNLYKIGMDMDCDKRLYKDEYSEEFKILFSKKKEDIWEVNVSNNIYIDVNNKNILSELSIHHGDFFYIRYKKTGELVFRIEYFIDFDQDLKRYNREIDLVLAVV